MNATLTQIVNNKNSTIIGFDFINDYKVFTQKLPKFHFVRRVKNFIDAQDYFGRVMNLKSKAGLGRVAEQMLGKSISKKYQKSNWTLRPLNLHQQ